MSVAGHSLSRPAPRTLLVGVGLFNAELAAVLAYFAFTDATLSSLAFTVYGLVWVNVSLFVFARYDPPAGGVTAVAVAVGYAVLLAVFGGLVGPPSPAATAGWRLALLPPGWGPGLVYGGPGLAVALLPAKLLGYGALVYLLYGSLAEASASGLAGLLGLFSCVSCSFPIIAGAAAAAVGGGSAVAAAATGVGYGPSTAVFLASVGLLWWRPGFGTLTRRRSSAG